MSCYLCGGVSDTNLDVCPDCFLELFGPAELWDTIEALSLEEDQREALEDPPAPRDRFGNLIKDKVRRNG